MNRRLNKTERRETILKAVITLANRKQGSYATLTRGEIARVAKCSPALITHYFHDMKTVRRDTVKYAIKIKNVRVIAQALLWGDLKKERCTAQLDLATLDYLRKLYIL